MSIPKTAATSVCGILVVLAVGCATTGAPRGWLPTASEAESRAHGGWIVVRHGASETRGELMSVSSDSLSVLATGGLTEIHKASISQAKLTAYDAQAGEFFALLTLGVPATGFGLALLGDSLADGSLSRSDGLPVVLASVGFGLIVTYPLSFLTGLIAAPAQSRRPQLRYPHASWEAFGKYVRYPQGPLDVRRRSSTRRFA